MNTKSDTLVILSPGFPKDQSDSVCLPPQQLLVRELKNNFPSLKILVLSFEYPFTKVPYDWYGVQVLPFNTWQKRKLPRLLIWFRIWRTLERINRQNRVLGLFSFWCAECALVGKYFSRLRGLPHFCWILGQDARRQNRYMPWIRPKGEELVAMSDFLSREFEKNYGVRPRYMIPNGIDASIYPPAPERKDIDVLGVGSLIPLKQYDLFIRLIAEIRRLNPNLKALLCGKGPEKAKLESLIRELGQENAIELTGELDHPSILRMMQRSKVFLHPSNYEGFSTVCLEALYAGAQVISFCQPLDQSILHWHVVKSREEMRSLLQDQLLHPQNTKTPVFPFSMRESASAIMRLYHYAALKDS
jgi:glycosyltransferase involved in cell wall biosynthesis